MVLSTSRRLAMLIGASEPERRRYSPISPLQLGEPDLGGLTPGARGPDETSAPLPESPFDPPDRERSYKSKSEAGWRPEGADATTVGMDGWSADCTPDEATDGDGWVDVHFHLMWTSGWSLADLQDDMTTLVDRMDTDGVAVTVLSATSYDFDTLPNVAQDVDAMVIQAILALDATRAGRVAAFLCGGYCGWSSIDSEADRYITWATEQVATYGSFIKGFGELIVHGHGNQHDGGNGFLWDLYRVAGDAGLAVLVHWDIGAVDAYTGDDGTLYCAVLEDGLWTQTTITVADQCQANFESFYRVAYENQDVTFILAHCGAGPRECGPYNPNPVPGSDQKAASFYGGICHPREGMHDIWKGWLEALLALDNVYFDIAGMIGDFDDDSDLVDILKTFMADHADRFLFGMDKTTDLLDTYSTVDGVAEYVTRLKEKTWFGLSDEVIEQIMRSNSATLLGIPTSA